MGREMLLNIHDYYYLSNTLSLPVRYIRRKVRWWKAVLGTDFCMSFLDTVSHLQFTAPGGERRATHFFNLIKRNTCAGICLPHFRVLCFRRKNGIDRGAQRERRRDTARIISHKRWVVLIQVQPYNTSLGAVDLLDPGWRAYYSFSARNVTGQLWRVRLCHFIMVM